MKIYTSYFAKAEQLKKAGIVPIGIALFSPKAFTGSNLSYLAPTRSMLSSSMPQEEYTRLYFEKILPKVDLKLFNDSIRYLSHGNDVALLCYEKPGDFCHRHLFAQWYEQKTGVKIEEWSQTTAAAEKQKDTQQSLF